MALVIEDGSQVSTAESYASVADADTYVATYLGGDATWDAASVTAKEVALREATQYIDGKFGPRFSGERRGNVQILEWPRSNVWTPDGEYIAIDTVPIEVVRATIEAGVRAVAGTLQPDETALGVKSERVKVGSIETETVYNGAQSTASFYPKIARLMWRVLKPLGEVARG